MFFNLTTLHSNFQQITFPALETYGILRDSPIPYPLDKEDKAQGLGRPERQAQGGSPFPPGLPRERRAGSSLCGPARGSPRKQHSWRDSLTDRPVSGSPAPSRTHLTPGPAPLLPGHTELHQAPGPPPPRCMLGFGFCAAADPALSQGLRGRADPVPPATADAGIALRVCIL